MVLLEMQCLSGTLRGVIRKAVFVRDFVDYFAVCVLLLPSPIITYKDDTLYTLVWAYEWVASHGRQCGEVHTLMALGTWCSGGARMQQAE